jgi:hypothetical protein
MHIIHIFIALRKNADWIFGCKKEEMVDVREGYNEKTDKNLNGTFYEGRNESI